jgi:integrase
MPQYAPYLRKEYNTFYAALEVPTALRPKLGRRFYQSLGTDSEKEAKVLAMALVADWKQQIDELRFGKRRRTYLEKALDFQAKGQEAKTKEEREHVIDELADYTAPWRHPDSEGYDPEFAETFIKVAEGKSRPTARHLDEWLMSLTDERKTVDDKRNAVLRFSTAFPMTHDVTRQKVRVWANSLLCESGLENAKSRKVTSPVTVRKIASHLRRYWSYLQDKGHVTDESDPFKEIMPQKRKKTKAESQERRKGFTEEDLRRLLVGAVAKKDQDLAALIWLGVWTGARLEELCSLRVEDVTEDRLRITDAKTPAGNRDIPLHSRLRPTVRLLKERSKDGFLMSGLTLNKYGDRSNAIGKRFGRLRTDLGFGRTRCSTPSAGPW